MREVTRLGEEMGVTEPTVFGMAHLANTLMYVTRFDEALEQAQRALAKAEQVGNAKYQAELLTLTLPVCQMRNGDFEAAFASIERGMEIALRIGDRGSEAVAATLQGKAAMARGAYEDALSLFRRASDAANATGQAFLQALGLCAIGTCYSEIGDSLLEQALDYHRQTVGLMGQPAGNMLGAWLWSEMGQCALAAGEPTRAGQLFERALTEPTAVMHLMRPLALQGAAATALAEGRVADARARLDECEAYVREREMRDHYPTLALLAARVAAAEGRHEPALARLAECEAIAGPAGMRRLVLEALVCRARSLDELTRAAEAAEARAAGRRVMEEIAADFRDGELRRAFVTGALARFA